MTRLKTAVSGAALCVALAAPAAIAQPYYPDDTATVGGMTIYGPRVVGRSSIGAPIEYVRESIVVPAADLDLRTGWGMQVLRRRIQRAAYDACYDLDARYPVTADDNGRDCYKSAVRDAFEQVAYRTGYAP